MLTELPERWYTKDNPVVSEYASNKWDCGGYIENDNNYYHENSTNYYFEKKPQNGYTEISFEDFKRLVLKEEKMEILKEKQQLSIKGIICEVYKRGDSWYYLTSRDPFIDQSSLWAALGISKDDKENFTRKVLGYYESGGFPECKSLEDLTKLVQAIKNYKMNKKIIGYKAPMDLYAGGVKKGHLYVKNSADSYRPETKVIGLERELIMPSTLVETWEPVYEQQKLNKVGVHDVTYPSKTVVKIGCTEYTKSQLKGAEMLLETKNIKHIMCNDGTKIDIGIIRQLIQGLES